VDVVKLGDVHKQSGRPPHLLAHLRGCSSMTKRRRRREATAALGLGFRRRVDGVATRVRIGSWGCDAALNRPEGLTWRAGQAQGCGLEADLGGGASDLGGGGHGRGEGDDTWGPPVIGCARGRRWSGLAAVVCWAGWAAQLLGCEGKSWAAVKSWAVAG
jgi:hypothetical protein